MSRNRFSEFIARRRENSLDDSGSPDSLASLGESNTNVDMEKYFTTLNGIERDIEGVNSSVDELGVLHGRLLSTADGDKSEAIARQRDQKTADINDTIKKLRSELNAVEQMNRNTQLTPGDEAIRRSRHAVLARKLMSVLDKYRTLERESQKRYRTRMEKHIRLVRPDATDEEVAEAAMNETSRSVFAMDVMSSYRSKVAKRMLRDVENRDRDIRDINRTIELLNRMFVDMQEIVAEQQDVLDNIEQAVDNTLDHTTRANEQKKWWLLFLLLILIIAIALSIALPVAM
ncbi:hypothetical protein LPJ53_003565 [Coemansia erecta]|uniref:t-SNARE coiled-coil homology domain-containing protein n=1 Tax=Coemansia erecta TaxID=147472 RepID=A0A9W8CSA7_9FUNG|nr:hypothetical protein LPJ53_003565 [Coemansia erecta]